MNSAERQAESQRVLLRNVKDQLAASKEQIIALKKKLKEVKKAKAQAEKAREEVKKAKDEVKQQGYNIGVVETKEALKVKVLGVCRNYCSQVWHEALNQAGVKASSILRKPESVYYPLAIQASDLNSSIIDTALDVAEVGKDGPAEVLTSSDKPSEVAKQCEATKKEKNANQGMPLMSRSPKLPPRTPLSRKKFPKRWILS